MGKIQSNLFRIDTISSESTTNSTDSELIHRICNVVYRMLTYLLGHESIQTTMVYLDITTKQEEKALETLEGENQKKMRKKWKTEEGKANLEILLGLTKTN